MEIEKNIILDFKSTFLVQTHDFGFECKRKSSLISYCVQNWGYSVPHLEIDPSYTSLDWAVAYLSYASNANGKLITSDISLFQISQLFFFNDPQFDVPVFQARIFYITNNVSTQIFPLFRRHFFWPESFKNNIDMSWIVTQNKTKKSSALILKILVKKSFES